MQGAEWGSELSLGAGSRVEVGAELGGVPAAPGAGGGGRSPVKPPEGPGRTNPASRFWLQPLEPL